MSRYIRTKTGIYKYHGEVIYEDNKYYTSVHLEILAMADKPEKLCEGFYIDVKGKPFNPLWVYKDFASCIKAATLLEENNIYGFVRTPNGFDFVYKFDNEVKENKGKSE